jgi:hypothetical protein
MSAATDGRRASERGSDSISDPEALRDPSDGSSTERLLSRLPRLLTGTRGGVTGVSDSLDSLMFKAIEDDPTVRGVFVEAGFPVRDTLPPVITLRALQAAVKKSPRARALLGEAISKLVYTKNRQGHFEASIRLSDIPSGADVRPVDARCGNTAMLEHESVLCLTTDARCADRPSLEHGPGLHDSVHCLTPPSLGFVKLGDIKFNSNGALAGQAPASSCLVEGFMRVAMLFPLSSMTGMHYEYAV